MTTNTGSIAENITPLPWTIDRETFDIVGPEDAVIGRIYTRLDFPCADPDEVEVWDRAGVEFEANADYVETAVNAYPKLVAVLRNALEQLSMANHYYEGTLSYTAHVKRADSILTIALAQIEDSDAI